METLKSTDIQWLKILRRTFVTLVLLIVVLVLLLLLGYQLLPVRQLQWSGIAVSWQQIRLAEMSLQTGKGEQWWDVQISGLEIGWRGWPLPSVRAQQLQLAPVMNVADQTPTASPAATGTVPAESPTAEADSNTSTKFQIPQFPELNVPVWLPGRIEIPHLLLQLPCQTRKQLCQLQGALLTSREASKHVIDLQLQGDGQQVQLQMNLRTQEQRLAQLNIRQLNLQLDVKALAAAGWIQGLPAGLVPENIQLQLSGYWQTDEVQLTLLQPLVVAFSFLSPAGEAAQLQLPAAQLQLQTGSLQCAGAHWQQCQLQLDAKAEVQKLQHPLLKTADWQWQGQAFGPLTALQLSGTIQNQQALKVTYQATSSPTAISMRWQLADLFFLAGNPLQITRLWPELLELQRGKISAEGELQLQLPGGQLNQLRVNAKLNELAGIYDRTAFAGLTVQLLLEADPRSFTLQLPELGLRQLNHGFQAGPARLAAQYRADWSAPASGDVRLAQAQIGMFGGQLALGETQFNLQQPNIEFRLLVRQMQLAALLKQHPSGQLLGEGVFSGTVPLRYQRTPPASGTAVSSKATAASLAQWQVLGGSLQAEAPGGRLQYQYQPVPGQKASGMDLAFEALSDFRYQTLASTVDLQPDGKVLLQVKLHGFNPKLQQGRPVHFNINVEEDLPALLTSLQLSSQISDKVRQRIQQKIQQQNQQKAKQQNQQKPAAKPASEKSQ
ncbi:hypothetical protein A5320_08855 [Rheinheimera sp. SA_1]|uniref:intermembrane phospholipid transport protein YdbH family protein n=1 Tax=Rheinheimera sp. SA_1 TaxID=1827365 RepID=UPI0007FECECC|nr:YdbH domain-containing protein [Rheinheimera sp. SA_1]OBP15455.1 hypothetical protein A5320_08855 [Rheinheimera sp. SA_1]